MLNLYKKLMMKFKRYLGEMSIMNNIQECTFRVANLNDAYEISKLDIPYNYKNNINLELDYKNNRNFRWIVSELEGKIIGFHRCLIVSGWAFWSGVFIDNAIDDLWLLYKLNLYVFNDLKNIKIKGQFVWIDEKYSKKVTLMEKLGFKKCNNKICRLIYDKKGLERISNSKVINKEDEWINDNGTYYDKINDLLQNSDYYINSIDKPSKEELSNWCILQKNETVLCAINWWVNGDTFEIHHIITKDCKYDITDGIIKILNEIIDENINIVKITIQKNINISLIRLICFKPSGFLDESESIIYKYENS